MSDEKHWDLLIIGSGPAGLSAAIQGAKAGRRVAVVERDLHVGGECVRRGTIPSKTLRESAHRWARAAEDGETRERSGDGVQVRSLMNRMESVVDAHSAYMEGQLERNAVTRIHGHACFTSPREVEVTAVDGAREAHSADVFLIATGSRPRLPDDIPVDHESIFDSDSILSLIYLPRSLTVLGGGVIASEYASVFAALGVEVTMIDRAPRPVAFLDPELSNHFLADFTRSGGAYLGEQSIEEVVWDGVSKVSTLLESGKRIESEKMLVALGRTANLGGLGLEAAGLATTSRGLLEADEHHRTGVDHIYAVGDVAGPPGLASSAMAQGRAAVAHALGVDWEGSHDTTPAGIYTIPEMSSVGMTEQAACEAGAGVSVGRARFSEVARGQISGDRDGLLKLVADGSGTRLLGVHIVGDGATELIHVGQMALIHGSPPDVFVENVFNFPTLAEAYRIAALHILNRRPQKR